MRIRFSPKCPARCTASLVLDRANNTIFSPVFLQSYILKTKKKSIIKRVYVAKHVFSNLKNRTDGSVQHQELRFAKALFLWDCGCPLKWQRGVAKHRSCSFETLLWSYQQILFGFKRRSDGSKSLSIKPLNKQGFFNHTSILTSGQATCTK